MRKLVLFLALTLSLLAAARPALASDLVLILDASGSMWGQVEGENKIVIARRVLGGLIDNLPDDERVGLVAYGHRTEGDCNDIETVTPLAPLDRSRLKATIDALNPKGKTPITRSLEQALDVARGGGGSTTILLVSDGLETCGGDPCATVRLAKQEGLNFLLHVVGFDVSGEDTSQLECAAQAGGGLFSSADDAEQLGAALDTAVALAPDVPAGRLSVQAVADGELQDAAVQVTHSGSGEAAGGGRTYTAPETNPRLIPLADGVYDIRVAAVGLRGDVERRFERVEIRDGATVEKRVDYSTGELAVGVTRNGDLGDATVHVRVAGTTQEVAGGRTYTSDGSNPKRFRITAGTYDVEVGSVEIAGDLRYTFHGVEVPPRGEARVDHSFESGTLLVGVVRGAERIDATVHVLEAEGSRQVAGGRTYTDAKSNPRRFELAPGRYRLRIQEIRGEQREVSVTLGAADEVVETVDLASGG
jgi:Ca-activated chloride channel homolog